jgi:DNA repair exonuclease SbcCD nuclease subunit
MAATAAEIARLVDNVVSHYHDRPTIVLGHFTIEGMAVQGTEFEVHQATEVVVPRSAFAHVALTAVGHIHRPQDLRHGIIAVGSLIRHSFAEKDDVKSYTLVSVDSDQVTWERRPVPCRDMLEESVQWGAGTAVALPTADVCAGKEIKLVVEIREDQLATFDPSVFDPIRAAAAYFVFDR